MGHSIIDVAVQNENALAESAENFGIDLILKFLQN